jgi:DNA polymerase epsilon subunit 2
VAFRTLTKKHNLTLTSSGLGVLSTFVGKFCGSGWREESLAERVLDDIAKIWKRNGGGLIIEDGADKKLSNILKNLEPCMAGGRLDMDKYSRNSSAAGTPNLSRAGSFRDHSHPHSRPAANRDDSQASLGLSGMNLDEAETDEDAPPDLDARSYLKVISAFDQPRLSYSTAKRTLESVAGPASLLSPVHHKTAMFRNRYNLVHQRLMRNESFQAPSFATATRPPSLNHSGSSVATVQQAYKITPVSNLLGRSGSSHLLLGMLAHSAAGDLALIDLSGSVVLDLGQTRPIPEDRAWFCPGMVVLVEGTYEEDGSHNSHLGAAAGVGGQIKGRFLADTMAGPPAERRALTVGVGGDHHGGVGAGFGWIDFLGVGSEKGIGGQMRRIQRRMFGPMGHETTLSPGPTADEPQPPRTKVALLGECNLDSPRVLEAIRAILASYTANEIDDLPLAVVLMGNFVSAASMAGGNKGGGSVEYKEFFDRLASVLAEFPFLLAHTTLVFVPGDNDPWASSFSAGGACVLPRQGVPEIFTSRIKRAFAAANSENTKKDKRPAGEAVWASNPARLSLFGPLEEMVLFRDDMTGRFRRNALTFDKQEEAEEPEEPQEPETDDLDQTSLDDDVHEATSHLPVPNKTNNSPSTMAARKLIKTVLDQSHLAPFVHGIRPVFWDHAAALSLYPLPSALVLADAEIPAFAVTYESCHVMNPGRVVDELGMSRGPGTSARGTGVGRWMEYDVRRNKGEAREVRF